MWGLTLDTILSAQIVLANGTLVTASKTQNADLFWVGPIIFAQDIVEK
jgi:FAD/FMN-containing dehydrogenase